MKGTIDLLATAGNEDDKAEKNVAFKNNAPFRSCISKINNILLDNSESLDIVMPKYNLLEYSYSYFMTSGILWNYYRDKSDEIDANDNDSDSGHLSIKQK